MESSERRFTRPTGRSTSRPSLLGTMWIGARQSSANSRSPWVLARTRCSGSRRYALRKRLVLTFYHAIADALSGIWVLHDVMRALAGEQLETFRSFPLLEEKLLGSSPNLTDAREAD